MPLPPKLDKLIRDRFAELITEGIRLSKEPQSLVDFYSWKTQVLSLLELIVDSSENVVHSIDTIRAYDHWDESVFPTLGILSGLKNDYESGILESLSEMIEDNITGDYLSQAEQLLDESKSNQQFNHVPAAVLTGAILEDALRRLCQRQPTPIPTSKPNGQPKMLNAMIDDLKVAGVYNELKAKKLRSWAAVRNHAAHGEFSEFTRQDVEEMLTGVQNFLADYL